MSTRFVNVDWDTPMLLPPDLREWVEQDDLAHFIREALALVDLSAAVVNERGTGRRQYPPGMMLAVLIYCYSHGILSSRQIERATYQHVAVRFLSGDTHPDHDTINEFRRQNAKLIHAVFVQVLQLAQKMGLLRLGTLSLDGTKVKSAASKRRTMRAQELDAALAEIEARVAQLLREVEQKEAESAAQESSTLPQELREAQARQKKLLAAKAELEQQARERFEAIEKDRRETPRGWQKIRAVPREPRPGDKVNVSEPSSTLTPTHRGFIQGYNGQVVVEADVPCGLIVAAEVVRDVADQRQLEPMIEQAVTNLGQAPCQVLVDSGYENTLHINRLQHRHGLEVLCPPKPGSRKPRQKPDRSLGRKQRKRERQRRRERFAQAEVRAAYARRAATVEPVIGILKTVQGLERFRCRSLTGVRTEWLLGCLGFNLRRLSRRWPTEK
jgi:transposase